MIFSPLFDPAHCSILRCNFQLLKSGWIAALLLLALFTELAAGQAMPKPRFGDQVISPQPLPLTLKDLDAIVDDDNAVLDALTSWLDHAPSQAPIFKAACVASGGGFLTNRFPYRVTYQRIVPYLYDASINNANPFDFSDPISALNDRLAQWFAYDYIGKAGGALNGAINAQAATKGLETLTTNTEVIKLSERMYRTMLYDTRSRDVPGAPAFFDFVRNAAVWAPQLAALATSNGYIKRIELLAMLDPTLARRTLNFTRYKLRLLSPAAEKMVVDRWMAPDLQGTVFPLAAKDSWPENYYVRLHRRPDNPVGSLLRSATNKVTRVELVHSQFTYWRPIDSRETVYVQGEDVWRFVATQAARAGLFASPKYPKGFKP
jgi:hypothetical protein